VILTCVRWYMASPLSLRHIGEMVAERGICVDHSTVHPWALELLPVLEKAFRHRKQPAGKSWRMEGSISSGLDKEGNTIDFPLRAHRDKATARRARSDQCQREIPISIRQSKYLNNLVEQDHRAIKQGTRPMLGFKSFRFARILQGGIEVMHMISKEQMWCARGTYPCAAD
jgi:putative transposase